MIGGAPLSVSPTKDTPSRSEAMPTTYHSAEEFKGLIPDHLISDWEFGSTEFADAPIFGADSTHQREV